jgi:hypothetical protein
MSLLTNAMVQAAAAAAAAGAGWFPYAPVLEPLHLDML